MSDGITDYHRYGKPKEDAEKNRRIEELKAELKHEKYTVQRANIKNLRECQDKLRGARGREDGLRSQLTDKESEQEELAGELSKLRDQLAEKEQYIKALRETNIDWSKVKKRVIEIPPDPEPTEAEVGKVKEELLKAYMSGLRPCSLRDSTEKKHECGMNAEARHVIERGYRREE